MGDNTGIEWTDATWNPVRGCSLVSEGCRNCYAMKVAHRFDAPGKPYEGLTERGPSGPRWNGEIMLVEGKLDQPLRWRKPRRVFVNSMSDLFHEGVPTVYVERVFAVMAMTPEHTYQVLTKRPERMAEFAAYCETPARVAQAMYAIAKERGIKTTGPPWDDLKDVNGYARLPLRWPLPNVWLGTSVEDQAAADKRIPSLLATPAAIRFLSCEPLLGPLSLAHWVHPPRRGEIAFSTVPETHPVGAPIDVRSDLLHWVIVGGESGAGARPMHPDWVAGLRDECRDAEVPFFFKQWGEWSPMRPEPYHRVSARKWSHELKAIYRDGTEYHPDVRHPNHRDPREHTPAHLYRVGKKAAGRSLDGRTWEEYPA